MVYILLGVDSQFIPIETAVVLLVVWLRTRTRALAIFANRAEYRIVAQFRDLMRLEVLKIKNSLDNLSEQ